MNKIIIALCAFLAVAYAEYDQVDNYIQLNRDRYHRAVNGYDTKLAYLSQQFAGRLEAVSTQKELTVSSIVRTKERLTPMALINGAARHCVTKYSGRIAGVKAIEQVFTECELIATHQLDTLLNATIAVRNALERHIENNFERDVDHCSQTTSGDYTKCVSDVISKANKFLYENEKSFEYELAAAECLAKIKVKKVVNCNYAVQVDVLTVLGQVDTLIGKCLIGEDECKPCEAYTCGEAKDVYGDFDNQTIGNPLYGRTDQPKCLMLNVYDSVDPLDLVEIM